MQSPSWYRTLFIENIYNVLRASELPNASRLPSLLLPIVQLLGEQVKIVEDGGIMRSQDEDIWVTIE